MSVNQFMSANIIAIQSIIGQIQRPFDSHAFIKRFTKEFQTDYVAFLSQYSNEPFREVHKQIGKFLSENQTELGIGRSGRIVSENIFGEQTENEEWL
jgi:hypothetical protein